MFLLCWEILKKSLESTAELGLLRDIIGDTSSPHLDLELGKRWSRGCASVWFPKETAILRTERKDEGPPTGRFFLSVSFRELQSYFTKDTTRCS